MSYPRPKRLNRQRIAEAALEIIDREGLPSLSMRRIGAELDVEGMALYRHYPQKDAILTEVVDIVVGRPEYPHTDDWRRNLRLLSLDLRARVLAHPNAMPLVAARWLQAQALQKVMQEARSEVEQSVSDAQALLHALMSFVLGYCWLEVGAFVGSLPDEGGLTRRSVSPDQFLAGNDSGESGKASEQFLGELEFLLAGPIVRRP
ncbi:MAG: TetR/AcrR family transcriptional regulator [Actinobacteria bacterium]|nr:TetR/AcrR family transcriptional regulator [Actinomycetota bacterium]